MRFFCKTVRKPLIFFSLAPANVLEPKDHEDVPCFSRDDEGKEGHTTNKNHRQRWGILVSENSTTYLLCAAVLGMGSKLKFEL